MVAGSRIGGERIQERGARVGQQHHVGFVDALPAGDRRAVEHLAVFEQARFDDRLREGHVVLHAAHVGEAQVDEFDLVVLDEFFDVFDGHRELRGRELEKLRLFSQGACQPPSG
jgi:hypothetical protein